MSLVSEFLVLFTYYGLGIIVVSLLVGHLLERARMKKKRRPVQGKRERG